MTRVAENPRLAVDAARRVLVRLLPNEAVEATEHAHADVDWRELLRCLDGVYLVEGGELGQWAFLRRPLDDLDGLTPAETLPLPGGPVAVMQAARLYVNQRTRRRLRVPLTR
jgi:hypothetical protein